RSSGWRPIANALDDRVPVRLVQESLKAIKALHRAVDARRVRQRRQHVRVLARDVLWSLDAAQPCRTPARAAGKSSVLRESASRRNLGLTLGQTVTGSGVVSLLEAVRFERGGLPLVLASDNGSENVNEDVEAYLAKKRVVHLRSLPRTPQHNAW